MQDLVDRCLSSNPVMRPSLPDISDALLALRDSLTNNTVLPPPHQSPLQQISPPQQTFSLQQTNPQQHSPFSQPSRPSRASMEGRQAAVTRQRINATQYQLPVRRQWVVSREGFVRQGSTPQPSIRQGDRIPAEWGRPAKLESKRSAPVPGEVAQAAAAASVAAAATTVPARAPIARVDSSSQTDASETARTTCLQQVWRTVGFCYMAKQTQSFREDPTQAMPTQAAQGASVAADIPIGMPTAVGSEVRPVDGVNAGSNQGIRKMSLRVKKMFAHQSKQFRQCMVTACK